MTYIPKSSEGLRKVIDIYIYMYLGILGAEDVKHNDMKQSILKEYDIFEKDQKDS